MFFYARSDTHFLLYVYDMMRNELVKRSGGAPDAGGLPGQESRIEWVLQRSKETSLLRFEFSPYVENGQGSRGWFNPLSKMGHTGLNSEQFAVYKAVHQWRDELARRADESTTFIMSQQTLMEVAKTLPSDAKGVYRLFHNASKLIKASIDELLTVITKAKLEARGGPTLKDFFQSYYLSKVDGPAAKSPERGDVETVDVAELRSGVSQLWGSVSMSSIYDDSGAADSRIAVEPIAITTEPPKWAGSQKPVVPKGSTTSVENGPASLPVQAESSMHDAAAASLTKQTADSEEEELDEEFTLRAHKKERRQDRKKQKQLAKEAAATAVTSESGENNDSMAVDMEDGEEDAFDYGTAPSVLHSKQSKGEAGGYNPYTSKTTAEGPKAERRRHGEKAGKTATFKR